MIETTTLGPSDIEIDRKHIDAIISVFPSNDPRTCVKDLIKGLFLLHLLEADKHIVNEKLKNDNNEQVHSLLLDLKSMNKKNLSQAEDYATKFINKMKYS